MAQIIGRCPHCGNIIHRETEQGLKDKYIGVCHTCDENFYTFEIENFVGAHADVSILYTAIEPGCDVYLTNDNEYIGKYIIDDDTDGQEYPYSEQEVIDIVNERYEQHCETIEDCIKFAKQFSDNEDDKFLFINQFIDGE